MGTKRSMPLASSKGSSHLSHVSHPSTPNATPQTPSPANLQPLPRKPAKKQIPLLFRDILVHIFRPPLTILLHLIHAITHNIQLLRPLIKLPCHVLSPALRRLRARNARRTRRAESREPVLFCGCGHHAFARWPIRSSDEKIKVGGTHVLSSGYPLYVGDCRSRRNDGLWVEELVLGSGKRLAGAPNAQHGDL